MILECKMEAIPVKVLPNIQFNLKYVEECWPRLSDGLCLTDQLLERSCNLEGRCLQWCGSIKRL